MQTNLNIRISKEDLEKIKLAAELSNMTVSEYVRELTTKGVIFTDGTEE